MHPCSNGKPTRIDSNLSTVAGRWLYRLNRLSLQEYNGAIRQVIRKRDGLAALIVQRDRDGTADLIR
jgi:hypothetical protein